MKKLSVFRWSQRRLNINLTEDLVQYENFYSKKIIQDKELGQSISWKNLFQII